MDILAVQQRVIDAGFQFREHIFNDGWDRNCVVYIAKKHTSLFVDGQHEWGWGRFPRHDAWRMVAEWLDGIECGEETID